MSRSVVSLSRSLPDNIGDAIIVLCGNGPKATVYGLYGAMAVVLLAAAALLLT